MNESQDSDLFNNHSVDQLGEGNLQQLINQSRSRSSSDFDGEENEKVLPLGGSYVPQSGTKLFSNRKFKFMHK